MFKLPSNSLLTVRRRCLCCGSLWPDFGVRVSVTFHLIFVHIILVRFRLLNGHFLGNSCSLGLPYVLFVFCLFVILVISGFGLNLGSDCFSS